jgi:hypothetical protein
MESVKISLTFSDGRRFFTEINAQVWLERIGLSRVSTGREEVYRMSLYPVEMLVPLEVAVEAIEDMLFLLPEEKVMGILRDAEERLKKW